MKYAKAFLIIMTALAIISAAAWQVFLKEQVGFGKVATAYAAKQICSCRFVSGRQKESCMTDFTQDISALTLTEGKIDTPEKTHLYVTASVLGGLISETAIYQPGLGCALQR